VAVASPLGEHIRVAGEVAVSIVVICPSRGRPSNIAELAGCFADPPPRLVVCVDDDDPTLDEYRRVFHGPEVCFDLSVGSRERMGPTLNREAVNYAANPKYSIIGFMGDDHRPRTPGWGQRIADAMTPMGVVYGNDLLQGEMLPTAVFVDAEIVRRLGYMAPPGLLHLYLDNFWKLLGERLGTLTYLADVVIEHVHPVAGKAEWDDSYLANNSDETYGHDRAVFDAYVANQLEADLEKLRV
jgi:hypothetical protein